MQDNAHQRMQDNAQELVRALFSVIESNGSSKALSGKLFQRKVIDFACLQKIRRAECDAEANAVLAEHLYRAGTEETLQDFAHILKEYGLPRQKALGEQIEAALAEASLSYGPVSSDERPRGSPRRPAAESSSDQELQQTGADTLTVIIILTITRVRGPI